MNTGTTIHVLRKSSALQPFNTRLYYKGQAREYHAKRLFGSRTIVWNFSRKHNEQPTKPVHILWEKQQYHLLTSFSDKTIIKDWKLLLQSQDSFYCIGNFSTHITENPYHFIQLSTWSSRLKCSQLSVSEHSFLHSCKMTEAAVSAW